RQSHGGAGAAAVAGTAETEARARAVVDAARDCKAAVATAAADALSDDAVSVITGGVDELRDVVQRHETAGAALGTRSANTHAHVVFRDPASDGETTRTATAAETLREHAMRVVAM